jgi:hypothetical protein
LQEASAEFEAAAARGEVVWAEPVLLADWLSDGAEALTTGQRAQYVIDRFNNRDSSSGWGRPVRGLSAYEHIGGVDGDYTALSANGYATMDADTLQVEYTSLLPVNTPDMAVWAVFSTDELFLGDGSNIVEAIVRDDGTGENNYTIRVAIKTAAGLPVPNEMLLTLVRWVGGVGTTLAGTATTLIHVAGHQYGIRVEANGSALRAKVWDMDLKIEPVDWAVEATDDTITTGNYGGVRGMLTLANTNPLPFTFKWHELRILDGSIDDLSDLAGQIVVTQTLDDGMPDSVSYVRDLGTSLLDAQITDGRRGLDVTQYLSPFNRDSPLYDLARDVAPVTLDHGIVTSAGPERLRLFTGRMIDLPVAQDKVGHLTALSDTRLKLTRLVQPPPFDRQGDLSASWIISWAASQCEVYAAPPPADGCRFYAPLHGSMQPFISRDMPQVATYQGGFLNGVEAGLFEDDGTLDGSTFNTNAFDGLDSEVANAYVDGPYVAGANLEFTSDHAVGMYYLPLRMTEDGDDIMSQAGPRGRFEFCVRGDAYASTAPSGATFTPATFIVGMFFLSSGGRKVYCGINMSRQLRIEMSDGTASINANAAAGLNLPEDGEWYKYGVAWDFVTETAYFYRRDPDGTEHTDSSTNSSLDVTRLLAEDLFGESFDPFDPAVDEGIFSPYLHAFIPVAELHLTSGTGANPDNAPWIWSDEYGFEPTAIFRRSATRLRAVAETAEREAWEMIGTLAQAEMAVMRVDERDRLLYLTPQYWAELAQQTDNQTLSTLTNVAELEVQIDPTRIRNMVRVRYERVRIDGSYEPVYETREVIKIPPGTTVLEVTLDVPTTVLPYAGQYLHLPSQSQVDAGVSSFAVGFWPSFMTINTARDGSGTYFASSIAPLEDEVSALVDEVYTAGTAVITVTNRSGVTVYTANDNVDLATISLGGIGVRQRTSTVSVSRSSSIARRGPRGLTVEAPIHQRTDDARRLARRLLNELAEPHPTLENVRVFGDQRRQPGDLVTIEDARGTAADGLWRLLRVGHVIDGANYYQTVRLRQALPVFVWGTTRWGQCIWGEEEA